MAHHGTRRKYRQMVKKGEILSRRNFTKKDMHRLNSVMKFDLHTKDICYFCNRNLPVGLGDYRQHLKSTKSIAICKDCGDLLGIQSNVWFGKKIKFNYFIMDTLMLQQAWNFYSKWALEIQEFDENSA